MSNELHNDDNKNILYIYLYVIFMNTIATVVITKINKPNYKKSGQYRWRNHFVHRAYSV